MTTTTPQFSTYSIEVPSDLSAEDINILLTDYAAQGWEFVQAVHRTAVVYYQRRVDTDVLFFRHQNY